MTITSHNDPSSQPLGAIEPAKVAVEGRERSVAQACSVTRLFAVCHAEHAASYKVLEKAGFTREGLLPLHTEFPNLAPGTFSDVFCYALVF